MHNDQRTTNDELAWLAFCYIAGELPRDEHQRFGQRLAEDQAAREAVAAAVEISHAAAIALATEPVAARRNSSHDKHRLARWVWAVAGTAACVAAVWGASQLSSIPASTSGELQTAALAEQWSEVREQSLATDGEEELDESAFVIEEDEALDAAPEWMLAAVEQHDMHDEGDMAGEIESNIEESREQ